MLGPADSLPLWRRAAALHPGERVGVIAPSGPLPEVRFAAGLARLRGRYDAVHGDGILQKQGFLAGSDERRWGELRWALSDPSLRAIFAGRGGYGLARNTAPLYALPEAEIATRPLLGFSDITFLHAFFARHRRISIHGPVVTQLDELPEDDIAALWALLESPAPPPPVEGLSPIDTRGVSQVYGRLLGGNLEVLSRLCGTALADALSPGEPVVLMLEEVSELPYRIDRSLTQMLLSGALRDVRAVVIGDLVKCDPPGGEGPTALEVIAERAAQLQVPVVAGLPLGHGPRNRPLPHGARVTLEPAAGRLVFHDGVVA
jgi:muramoyltetrapeptide carboxypeptidase